MLKKSIFYFLMDLLLVNLSLFLAFIIRFENGIPKEYTVHLFLIFIFAALARLAVLIGFRVYNIIWKYSGLTDILHLIGAIFFGSAIFVTAVFFNRNLSFPRAVLLIDFFLCIFFLLGYRIFPAIRPHLSLLNQARKGKKTALVWLSSRQRRTSQSPKLMNPRKCPKKSCSRDYQ